MGPLEPPWTTALDRGEHDLILFALVATALALLATLVRIRFSAQESHGSFRVASLTASAVVALALVSYVGVIGAFLLGYDEVDGRYVPNSGARIAAALRYADWVVTVPLLVLELIAISAVSPSSAAVLRRIGIPAAVAMVLCGFLGAFVVGGGTDFGVYTAFGLAGAVCFAVLYGLFFSAMVRSLPRLPEAARGPYRAAVILLLVTWLAYPIVYGFAGVLAGGAVAVTAQIVLCGADMVAKIGFGTLVHRTAVLRSRNDDHLDPGAEPRPRPPRNESIYVGDSGRVQFDED